MLSDEGLTLQKGNVLLVAAKSKDLDDDLDTRLVFTYSNGREKSVRRNYFYFQSYAEPGQQASGAYIFRAKDETPVVVSQSPKLYSVLGPCYR